MAQFSSLHTLQVPPFALQKHNLSPKASFPKHPLGTHLLPSLQCQKVTEKRPDG